MGPQHIHIVGIGGAGMSPLARILLQRGDVVSGSDEKLSPVTEALRALGAAIYQGHRAEHVTGADLIVTTAAARADNPELVAARASGIPVIKGAVLLGQLMQAKRGICVAGTHGKTTTTAMIAAALRDAGKDPSYVVGGEPRDLPASGNLGHGPHFVAEADEFDRRFLSLHPTIAVVTSLEADHPDCYPTMADLEVAFWQFVGLVPADGVVVACGDDARVQRLRGAVVGRFVTYGLLPGNDWRALDIRANAEGGSDFALVQGAGRHGTFRLIVPGHHNVRNALAAIAVGSLVSVPLESTRATLAAFRGVARRFEVVAEARGIVYVDDYAHHPSEIRATLAAARQRYPGRRIVAVHQPHTYSRLKALLMEFAAAFADADEVVIVDVYAARETDTLDVHSRDLVAVMRRPKARYIGGLGEAAAYLRGALRPGDVLVSLGAGDVNQVIGVLLREASCGGDGSGNQAFAAPG